ncbi:hypothetical protein L1987_55575 [Smallanthus sonchifolius]|uniref:Uncharacterized protein n=1 Tax=Smallanthus sonchifolius TaxID=185202 RepID=A0ACB9EA37_9ASTR|nr:hypothetical protein L1987_55575 [Smallanthus sonchifolius]
MSLTRWAQDSIKEGRMKHIIDSDIRDEISPNCLKGFVQIAERCLDEGPEHRPAMAEVVSILESLLNLQERTNNLLLAADSIESEHSIYTSTSAVEWSEPCHRSLDEEGWVFPSCDSIKEGHLKHVIDSDIRDEISPECLNRFVQIVERCLDKHPKHRPTMAEVVSTLESVLNLQEKTNNLLQAAWKTRFGRKVDKFSITATNKHSGMEFGFRIPKKRKLLMLREKILQQNEAKSFINFPIKILQLKINCFGKKPIDREIMEDGINLSTYFVRETKENRLREIVDPHVLEAATDEQLSAACDLVHRCLEPLGGNRPSMKEVTMELQRIRKLGKTSPG